MIEELDLSGQIKARGLRSEDLAREVGEHFTTVIARAVSSLPVVMELATPLLVPGGELIALRGKEEEQTPEQLKDVADKLGLELVSKRNIYISEIYERNIYVYKKIGPACIKLPRRNGIAQKKPLG